MLDSFVLEFWCGAISHGAFVACAYYLLTRKRARTMIAQQRAHARTPRDAFLLPLT